MGHIRSGKMWWRTRINNKTNNLRWGRGKWEERGAEPRGKRGIEGSGTEEEERREKRGKRGREGKKGEGGRKEGREEGNEGAEKGKREGRKGRRDEGTTGCGQWLCPRVWVREHFKISIFSLALSKHKRRQQTPLFPQLYCS